MQSLTRIEDLLHSYAALGDISIVSQEGIESASAGLAPLINDDAEVVEGLDDRLHVAANLGACAYWNFVGLFNRYYAAVGPGALGDGVQRGSQLAESDVQVVSSGAQGPWPSVVAFASAVTTCNVTMPPWTVR